MRPSKPIAKRAFLWLYAMAIFCVHGVANDLVIRDSGFNETGQFFVRFVTTDNYYYVLRRGSLVAKIVNARDLSLPSGAELLLEDEQPDPDLAFYRVEAIFVSAPADVDYDGIDDLYELQYSSILDPNGVRESAGECMCAGGIAESGWGVRGSTLRGFSEGSGPSKAL